MTWIEKAQDKRTAKRFKKDFERGTKAERSVMIAFNTWYRSHGIDCYSEKIGEDVFLDDVPHDEPDYFFFKGDEKHTLEIKYSNTGNFKEDTVAIRPSAIFKMKKRPNVYPRGKALIATPWEFSTIDVDKLTRYEYFKPWDKKVFKVDPNALNWFTWLVPLVL